MAPGGRGSRVWPLLFRLELYCLEVGRARLRLVMVFARPAPLPLQILLGILLLYSLPPLRVPLKLLSLSLEQHVANMKIVIYPL